jgi:tetratricopeptide (TPR) repeat protein
LPPELAGTIRRCLEKRPQARFQSASDLAYNLRTISSASVPSGDREVPRVRVRSRSAVWFALAAAGVIAVAAGVAVWAPWRRAPEPTPEVLPNRIAIVPFENRTGDPSLDTLGVMAADLIEQRFIETGAAEVVPMADIARAAQSGTQAGELTLGWDRIAELARESGAVLVASGAYYLDDESLRLQARLVDTATGDLIYSFEPVAVVREKSVEGIETLRERVLAAVAAHVICHDVINIAVMRPPSSYEAFQSFQRGEELFARNMAPESIAQFRRALEIDPEFHSARYFLICAYASSGDRTMEERELSAAEKYLNQMTPYDRTSIQYRRAESNQDLQGAAHHLRHMIELWPQSVEARWNLGACSNWLNRPREAVEVLEPIVFSIDRNRYATPWSLLVMTNSLHMLGDYERELEYADLGLEKFPNVAGLHVAKARALAAMGLAVEAKEVIDACFPVKLRESGWNLGQLMTRTAGELRAHGHRRASDDMAARAVAWWGNMVSELGTEKRDPEDLIGQSRALFIAGRWDEAREPLEELRERGADPIRTAGPLGVIAARLGNHEEARRIFEELPDPGGKWGAWDRSYWRAAIAAQLGEQDRAVALLVEAFSQGMRYYVTFHIDPMFEPLWDYPPFQELIEPKG